MEFIFLFVISHFLTSSIKISLYIHCSNSDVTIFFISIIISTRVNAIIKKGLDFENDYDIPLTLRYRHIGPRIKDIDVIMLVPRIIHNMKYYR